MISPPLLAYSGVVAELAPPIAILATRSRDRARIGVAVWCLLLFATNVATRWLGARHENSLVFNYFSEAIAGAWLLWVLSCWQARPVSALALRLLIQLYFLTNLVLIATVEDTDNFSHVTSTLNGFLLLTLVLFTLISRSLDERVLLTQFDWFWVCGGLVLYMANEMATFPLARVLVRGDMDLLVTLLTARSLIEALAMLIITRGLLCPTQPLPSGGFSLPPSSRPSSYS